MNLFYFLPFVGFYKMNTYEISEGFSAFGDGFGFGFGFGLVEGCYNLCACVDLKVLLFYGK